MKASTSACRCCGRAASGPPSASPAIEPVFGLGKLVFHLRLPDGRRLIRLEGLGRVQLVRELPMTNLFRQVEAAALPEPPVFDKSSLLLLRSQIERLARLSGDGGDALGSLLALPDPRILLYALTAFLPSLELMGGHDVASAAARRELVDLQQQSLAAETPEDRLTFLVDRTATLLRRLGEVSEASILLNQRWSSGHVRRQSVMTCPREMRGRRPPTSAEDQPAAAGTRPLGAGRSPRTGARLRSPCAAGCCAWARSR